MPNVMRLVPRSRVPLYTATSSFCLTMAAACPGIYSDIYTADDGSEYAIISLCEGLLELMLCRTPKGIGWTLYTLDGERTVFVVATLGDLSTWSPQAFIDAVCGAL